MIGAEAIRELLNALNLDDLRQQLRIDLKETNSEAKRKPLRLLAPAKKTETEFYISPDYVNDSFVNYDCNNFVQYLINRFGLDKASELVGKSRIGTSN